MIRYLPSLCPAQFTSRPGAATLINFWWQIPKTHCAYFITKHLGSATPFQLPYRLLPYSAPFAAGVSDVGYRLYLQPDTISSRFATTHQLSTSLITIMIMT
jgi:hypothetical protein